MHCIAVEPKGKELLSCADQPGYPPNEQGVRVVAKAKIRVAHNGQDYDDRLLRKLYKHIPLEGRLLDTLIIARLLYARVFKTGPNNHKLPGNLRMAHSLKAWGMRLGEHKGDFDGGDWQTWDPEMSTYMNQDVKTLKRIFMFLMSRKPSPQAVTIEHDFAEIMRRQEAWGFTFDFEKATKLAAELQTMEAKLEASLIEKFGEWWEPGDVITVRKSRKVKLPGYPNVTIRRYSPSTGKEIKPYVGPPLCSYEEGAEYTPIERVTFNPRSRDHVRLKLMQTRGWKPQRYTKPTKSHPKGEVIIDDEVLRQMPWPEAQELADFYVIGKLLGYITVGKKAWLRTMVKEGNEYRQHGRITTIGTYTHRPSLSDPNMGQIPAVSLDKDKKPIMGLLGGYGYECRDLFKARQGFRMVGCDGSGIQLRMLGHYLAPYDGGEYSKIVANSDPHAWMRDTVGTDIMGEGGVGREHGKTLNYAILLGAGDKRAGSIPQPLATEAEQTRIGKDIKHRIAKFFPALPALKEAIKEQVHNNGFVIGLDGRRIDVLKSHTGLATLLQSAETITMKKAIALLDRKLRSLGLRCGVAPDGSVYPVDQVDYEFLVNVYDEFQADVKPHCLDTYVQWAPWSITEAGILLKVQCDLKGEVKIGDTWAETH